MLLQSFVSLCMKITNSAVGVGLYYGFLTTFSIRPAYLFLFVEEPEQKAAAITGLIMGQLVPKRKSRCYTKGGTLPSDNNEDELESYSNSDPYSELWDSEDWSEAQFDRLPRPVSRTI
uniref:Protein TIC 214 n=1 Tax=Lobelia siphilitica var. siphilitica TaxID=1929858 RepID=A0A1L6BUV8_LOBSI|nr:hypothetical protein Lo_si_si1Pt0331 [Lobelia siphilitica var. siphilitica]